MTVRLDGATRADRAEATALLVAGAVLLMLPFVAVLDRMGELWFGVTLLAAGGGVFIGALGVRWFSVEGPPLAASSPVGHRELPTMEIELPASLRLVEAASRLRAHGLRFAALGSAVLLLVVDVGDLKWVVVALFGVSFVADHILLRPRRFVIDADGLRPEGRGRGGGFRWEDVSAVYWRWYPADMRPPFPSGERIIVELEEQGLDLEFVFHRRYGGSDASMVIQAALPVIGDRIKVLSPASDPRAQVDTPAVSETME
ncbi:MAG: hypothetical protein GY898_31595 [Proteobacteria bacterium]|nr:hypothetical protein [Pseudomonadota bacterium]